MSCNRSWTSSEYNVADRPGVHKNSSSLIQLFLFIVLFAVHIEIYKNITVSVLMSVVRFSTAAIVKYAIQLAQLALIRSPTRIAVVLYLFILMWKLIVFIFQLLSISAIITLHYCVVVAKGQYVNDYYQIYFELCATLLIFFFTPF